MTRALSIAILALLLADCVGPRERETEAPPVQQRPPRPVPPPPPPPSPPPPTSWADLPLTRGDWAYGAQGGWSEASFGGATAPAPGGPLFRIRCDRASNRLTLERFGSTPASTAMIVTTSYGSRSLAAGMSPDGPSALGAALDPRDALLDQMIFSRGHFSVEAAGLPRLVIPTWPEAARVVEDCRS